MMCTRFAPSLTGYLHLGHVLHMIYLWGAARREGAEVLCRIEDHDVGRARPEYESAILQMMEWLGFMPDLGLTASDTGRDSPFRQSGCISRYEAMLDILLKKGLIYGCDCTRKEIVSRQGSTAGELCYDGHCAERDLPLEGHTVRFRLPADTVVFKDLQRGDCSQTPRLQCGDLSLRDRQGNWTYQFCCVCDDIEQHINLVIRGEDLLESTGRQILLFQALDREPPRYLHHPLLLDESGEKLSKRQRSESLSALREQGVSAEEIIGRAAVAGGLTSTYTPLSSDEAIARILHEENPEA